MARSLPVLCPQEYAGTEMRTSPCNRCDVGWDRRRRSCTITTGCEHLPVVAAADVPACPIADRCQHQLQSQGPCTVRSRGLVCESALVAGGMPPDEAMNHPLSFHAMMIA